MKNKTLSQVSVLLFISLFLFSCTKKEEITPVRKDIENAVFASGFVTQENEYILSGNVSGLLQNVSISEGDQVHYNQLIASVKSNVQNTQLQDAKVVMNDAQNSASSSSAQLTQIKTQIHQAQNQLQLDRLNYQRYIDLKRSNSVSQLDLDKAKLQYEASQNNLIGLQKNYEEAKNALSLSATRSQIQVSTQQAVLSDYQIKSEKAGTVIHVNKKSGELIRPGEVLATIGSGNYVIKMYVSEDDIVNVNLGQNVAVQLNTEPDKTYKARVSKIHPGFDESDQSYIVEATFIQLPQKIYSKTQLQANIETQVQKNVLVIPTRFISKGKYVTLKNGEQREIKIGNRDAQWAEVISGITEKDKIVIEL